jgi:hypothetical protein
LSPCTFQSATKFAAKISLSLRIFRAGLGEPLVVEVHPLNCACAQAVRRVNPPPVLVGALFKNVGLIFFLNVPCAFHTS